jgi:chloride channel protein, CIC family
MSTEEKQRRLSPLLRGLLIPKLWSTEKLRFGERQVTLAWAAVIGIFGALVTECFRRATDFLHFLFTGSEATIITSFKGLPLWQRFLVPVIGGILAGLTLWIGNRLIARVRQKSTTDYMEAVVVGNGVISLRASLVKTISALFSISSGASIGREGPLVQLSSLAASLVGRLRNCPIPQRRHLVACGAAAGIASAYNAPIAGAFFVAEIVLGTVVFESLGPLILASVTATFLSRAFDGESPLYQSPALDLNLHTQWEIAPLCAIGIFMGFLAPLYLQTLRRTEGLLSKLPLPIPAKLGLGGVVVGLLAMFYPEVCGNGKGLVTSLFHQNWDFYTLLILVIVKLIATVATFGSGAVGGVFTPTLFIGSAIGVLYGQAVLFFAPQLQSDRIMYGLLGMGSFLAATTGAPLLAILMVFELTLSYAIVPFLMIACVLGYYCSSFFERRFMYGESLERKGAAFFNRQLAEVDLVDLIKRDPITLPQNATFAQIAQTFVQHQFQHIYIVDGQRKLLGAVSLHQVKALLDRPELETVVIAGDIMDETFPSISPLHSTVEALQRFSETRSERLPVVDSPALQRLIGSISKTDIILHLAGEQKPA